MMKRNGSGSVQMNLIRVDPDPQNCFRPQIRLFNYTYLFFTFYKIKLYVYNYIKPCNYAPLIVGVSEYDYYFNNLIPETFSYGIFHD